jgi:hypothetical protein
LLQTALPRMARRRRAVSAVAFSPEGASLLVVAGAPTNQIVRFDVAATP